MMFVQVAEVPNFQTELISWTMCLGQKDFEIEKKKSSKRLSYGQTKHFWGKNIL